MSSRMVVNGRAGKTTERCEIMLAWSKDLLSTGTLKGGHICVTVVGARMPDILGNLAKIPSSARIRGSQKQGLR